MPFDKCWYCQYDDAGELVMVKCAYHAEIWDPTIEAEHKRPYASPEVRDQTKVELEAKLAKLKASPRPDVAKIRHVEALLELLGDVGDIPPAESGDLVKLSEVESVSGVHRDTGEQDIDP